MSSFVPMSLYLMDSLVVLIVIAMTLSTLAHVFYNNSKNKLSSQISQTDFHFFSSKRTLTFWSVIFSKTSFMTSKCGRKNFRGLGTDVMDVVEERIMLRKLSSAAFCSSGTGS